MNESVGLAERDQVFMPPKVEEFLRPERLPLIETTSESSCAQSASASYFPALDGIRALAFLMVFSMHYFAVPWGWAGVDVFFVLSGFLITGILFDTKDHPHRVWNFYLRRTLRIFPLYYGLMLLLLLLYPVFRWNWDWSWMMWPAYLGNFAWYLHPHLSAAALHNMASAQPHSRSYPSVFLSIGHFWSLCVEEQFYLLWPWVVFWVRDRRKLIYVCLAFVVACPILRVVGAHGLSPYALGKEVLYRATPLRMDALLLGGLVALLRRGPHARTLLVAARIGFVMLYAAALLWLAFTPAARHARDGYVYPAWAFTWGLLFIDLFSACLMVQAMQAGSMTWRLFNQPILRWLGRISYGLYVFHDILHAVIMHEIQKLTNHWVVPTAAVAFASTIAIAWASYRWFETPFIRLKDRYTRDAAYAPPHGQGWSVLGLRQWVSRSAESSRARDGSPREPRPADVG